MAPGGPEQVPGWFMMPMGGAGQPTSDLDLRVPNVYGAYVHLSLRFHMILGPRTLSLHACAAKSPKAEFRHPPLEAIFWGFGPWAGT